MLTNPLFVLAASGVDDPSFADILGNILSAIGSVFEMALNYVKTLVYLFSPVDIDLGTSITAYNTFVRTHSCSASLISMQVINGDTHYIIQGNPLLFIFLCLSLVGLGIGLFKRLSNVN